MTIRYGPWVKATRSPDDRIQPDEIVRYARSWIGAKWRHQARGNGNHGDRYIDCAGLMQRIMAHFGMEYQDVFGYSRQPGPEFVKQVEKLTLQGNVRENWHGALAVFSDGTMPCHVGILAEDKGKPTVIHAESYPKRRTYEGLLMEGYPTMYDNLVDVRWFKGVDYV